MPGRGDLKDKLKKILLKIHAKSQYEFVFHPQIDFITIDGEIRVDHILKFENLQVDWNKHFNVPLKHSNQTHDKIHVEIDDETDKLIRLIYRKDIELWNSIKN